MWFRLRPSISGYRARRGHRRASSSSHHIFLRMHRIMKRSFGTMINPSAVGNPIVRSAARLAAAAIVIQSFFRGQVDRRLAGALGFYYLIEELL